MALVVVLVRWWVSHDRRVVHLNPDEPGQLAIARLLGRGARWSMGDHSTWRPGFGALLSPATWFTDDPVDVLRAGYALNAVLGGASCLLLFHLARRLSGLPPRACAVLAGIASLAPAVVLPTAWVWSESLAQAIVLLAVVLAGRFLDRPTAGRGCTFALGVAAGFAAHSRLLPLAALVVALAAVVVGQRRADRRVATLTLATLVVALLIVSRWSAWVVDRLWEDPAPTNTAGGVVDRLRQPVAVAESVIGQSWYQLASTLGVAGLGLAALAHAAWPRRRRPPGGLDRRTAAIVLGAVVPLVALSMVFQSDRWRPDHLVYGRYNDAVIAPVIVAGLAVVLAERRRALRWWGRAVAVMIAAAAVLHLTAAERLAAPGAVRPMILGLAPLIGRAPIDVVAATGRALVGIAAVAGVTAGTVVAGRLRRGAVTPLIAVGVAFGVVLALAHARAQPVVDASLNTWAGAAAVREVADVLPAGTTARVRTAHTSSVSPGAQAQRVMLYRFHLPTHELRPDEIGGPTTPYVFAPVDDPVARAGGAAIVWRDPQVGMALWREAVAVGDEAGPAGVDVRPSGSAR